MAQECRWTVAYRALLPEPEPVFHRADHDVTWGEASTTLANEYHEVLGTAYEVWWTTTRASELTDRVAREDVLNLLQEDGVRVPIADDGEPAEVLRARLYPYEATREE